MRSRPRAAINQQQFDHTNTSETRQKETRHYKTRGCQVRRHFPPLMAPVQPWLRSFPVPITQLLMGEPYSCQVWSCLFPFMAPTDTWLRPLVIFLCIPIIARSLLRLPALQSSLFTICDSSPSSSFLSSYPVSFHLTFPTAGHFNLTICRQLLLNIPFVCLYLITGHWLIARFAVVYPPFMVSCELWMGCPFICFLPYCLRWHGDIYITASLKDSYRTTSRVRFDDSACSAPIPYTL